MKYAVCSDIHLGHVKTPTKHIISSFKKHILNDNNKDIQVLFISGDLFDRLLDLNSVDVKYIVEFFNYFLTYCTNNNIAVRVLEGTPGHDYQQSQLLVELNNIRSKMCNLKYFKALDIEYNDILDKYILYVPDEWTNDHDELERQIKQKLNEHSITSVDIAILHGQFKYQFAGKPYHGFHYKEDYFLDLVKGYIHVGHYHTYNPMSRILPNGSLERLKHGEEEAKGYIIVNDDTYTFIENTDAFIYKSINVTPKMTLERLDKIILVLPKNSFIRLVISKDHPLYLTFNDIVLRYMDYNVKKITKENLSENNQVTYILTDKELELNDKFILEGNLHTTLVDLVKQKHNLDSLEESKFLNYISIFKEVENNEPNSY